MEKIIKELENNEENLIKLILSDSMCEIKKIVVRPILIKSKQVFQIEKFIGSQVFHENVEFCEILKLNFNDFKQITIEKNGETSVRKIGLKLDENPWEVEDCLVYDGPIKFAKFR